MKVAILLFNDYETLDVFGPVEILGRLKEYYNLTFYSLDGGLIKNHHGISILTNKLEEIDSELEIFLIPGGIGTRKVILDLKFVDFIRKIAMKSKYVLTVCTGSALLAKTGLLDRRNATSNKRAMTWVMTNGTNVNWNKTARWSVDGKFYTSSGVSAGMDMTLGFLSDRHGDDFARNVAAEIEYNWIDDKDNDTFKVE